MKAGRANFGVIKRLSLLVFLSPKTTADSVNKGCIGAGPGHHGEWIGAFMISPPVPAGTKIEAEMYGDRNRPTDRFLNMVGDECKTHIYFLFYLETNTHSKLSYGRETSLWGWIPFGRHLGLACLCRRWWGDGGHETLHCKVISICESFI